VNIQEFITKIKDLNIPDKTHLLDKDMVYLYIQENDSGLLFDPLTYLASTATGAIYPLEMAYYAGEALGLCPGDIIIIINTIDGIRGTEDTLYKMLKGLFVKNETQLSHTI
jgi:hypothetical protein